MEFHYESGGERRTVRLAREGDGFRAAIGDRTHQVVVDRLDGNLISLRIDGRPVRAWFARRDEERFVGVFGADPVRFERGDGRRSRGPAHHGTEDTLTADMHGQVVAIPVAEGDLVEKGRVLVVLEAMKMELRILAPHDGRVKRVHCRPGDVVERGRVVIELESREAEAG